MMADYITRDEAQVEYCKLCGICKTPGKKENVENACIKSFPAKNPILEIPAADVRPVVRGHWEDMPDHDYTWKRCSVCGTENAYAYILDLEIYEYVQQDDFCPKCGADMRP